MAVLTRIQVKGFKSIREMDLELRNLNVLIGANGAGKSNLLSVFHLLRWVVDNELQRFVAASGLANALLHRRGPLRDNELALRLLFDQFGYDVRFIPTANDSLVFADERVSNEKLANGFAFRVPLVGLQSGLSPETHLYDNVYQYGGSIPQQVIDQLRQLWVYHLADTAPMKHTVGIVNSVYLHQDASNIAAVLYALAMRHTDSYKRIVETIQLAAPYFKDFGLHPDPRNSEMISLTWRQHGVDTEFGAYSLPDGLLRFIALATLLLQPASPPVILIDEPELGLHPAAIVLLASIIKSVATKRQIIVSTQSVTLVNQFLPEDIVVVEREGDQSVFKRPTAVPDLEDWLEDYTLGELWEKNVIGGRP